MIEDRKQDYDVKVDGYGRLAWVLTLFEVDCDGNRNDSKTSNGDLPIQCRLPYDLHCGASIRVGFRRRAIGRATDCND